MSLYFKFIIISKVHLDPIQYHHLYMYLAHRSATVKELAKVIIGIHFTDSLCFLR